MSALVPYEAAELSPLLMAEAIKDAKWAAKKIGRGLSRAYRARKARSKKRRMNGTTKVGYPERNIHMKREQTVSSMGLALGTRSLATNNLTVIGGGGTGEDERHRQIINCKGIQVCYHVRALKDFPVFFNAAIIALKHNQSGVSATEFFRSNNGDRGTNFSTTLTALELAYLPINADLYTILRHHRHQLNARIDGTQTNSDAGPGNWISKKIWLPVNRQLRFENTIASSATTPIYFVFWCDRMDAAGGTAVDSATCSVSLMHTMFYTDVL